VLAYVGELEGVSVAGVDLVSHDTEVGGAEVFHVAFFQPLGGGLRVIACLGVVFEDPPRQYEDALGDFLGVVRFPDAAEFVGLLRVDHFENSVIGSIARLGGDDGETLVVGLEGAAESPFVAHHDAIAGDGLTDDAVDADGDFLSSEVTDLGSLYCRGISENTTSR
jgi:hypothetical protein